MLGLKWQTEEAGTELPLVTALYFWKIRKYKVLTQGTV